MSEKYTEIVALVHPLYDVFYTFIKSNNFFVKGKNPNVQDILKDTKNGKVLKAQIKKSLGIYGELLNSYINKKNACVVIYLPSDHEDYSNYRKSERNELKKTFEVYDKMLFRFLKHYKIAFTNRLHVTGYDKGLKGVGKFLSKDIFNRLGKSVNLTLFGEYYNPYNKNDKGCVYGWGVDITNALANHGKFVDKINLLTEKTLSFNPTKSLSAFEKAILPKHEKRVLQKKFVKAKKKLNKKPR